MKRLNIEKVKKSLPKKFNKYFRKQNQKKQNFLLKKLKFKNRI